MLDSFSSSQVIFKNESHFLESIAPYTQKEVTSFLNEQFQIQIDYDSSLSEKKIVPLPQDPHLSYSTVFEHPYFKVCAPQFPRVPHQLSLIFNSDIRSIMDLKPNSVSEMHKVIQKITEIYAQKLDIEGYVLAHYLEPAPRHHDQYIVEILPHQPGLSEGRDFLDKADSNRYVLYGDQNYSHLSISFPEHERDQAIAFWEKELNSESSLSEKHTVIQLPTERKDYHIEEGKSFCLGQLLEYFENQGAQVNSPPLSSYTFTKQIGEPDLVWQTASCAFCNPNILKKQTAFEYNDICVLYNFRKMPHEATSFLILPKRHTEQNYGLTNEEVQDIHLLQKALMQVLKEKFPDFDIILYNQGHFSVGQTVPHTHDQVVALDPKSAPFHWSMLALAYKPNPTGGISSEEMQKVTEEFSILLQEKVDQLTKDNQHQEAV